MERVGSASLVSGPHLALQIQGREERPPEGRGSEVWYNGSGALSTTYFVADLQSLHTLLLLVLETLQPAN